MAQNRANKTIFDFKSALVGGGARPNLFEVELATLPEGITGWDADNFRLMCKSAQLPGSNIGSIDVPFRGRIFKVAGDRTFDSWTVTIINDEGFKLRTAFEDWMEKISKLSNNIGATNPSAYMVDATVYQLGRSGGIGPEGNKTNAGTNNAVLAVYTFESIFPTNVSPIDLSYDSSDTIEEFTVEFQVQSYKKVNPAASSNG